MWQKSISKLYIITPNRKINFKALKLIFKKNIQILQYRRKIKNIQIKTSEAFRLKKLCKQYNTLFIINDDIELAKIINADGVHLGQNDVDIKTARKYLGENKIIGITCHNSINLALKAQKNSADYVAFGAVFPSPTKPNATPCALNIISKAKKLLTIPIVAIGGINNTNKHKVLKHGADSVAMISAA